MREKLQGKLHMDALLALLLFAVFTLGILGVLLTGADAYRALTLRDQSSYDTRTLGQYLATKVRQSELFVPLAVEEFGDGQALVLADQLGDEIYLTRLYCHDGWLMELFTTAQGGFLPADGEKILPARTLSASVEGNLLQIALTQTQGSVIELILSLRAGEGERQ